MLWISSLRVAISVCRLPHKSISSAGQNVYIFLTCRLDVSFELYARGFPFYAILVGIEWERHVGASSTSFIYPRRVITCMAGCLSHKSQVIFSFLAVPLIPCFLSVIEIVWFLKKNLDPCFCHITPALKRQTNFTNNSTVVNCLIFSKCYGIQNHPHL